MEKSSQRTRLPCQQRLYQPREKGALPNSSIRYVIDGSGLAGGPGEKQRTNIAAHLVSRKKRRAGMRNMWLQLGRDNDYLLNLLMDLT